MTFSQAGKNRRKSEVAVRDVKREHAVGCEPGQIQRQCLSSHQVNRNRIGAERVEDDQTELVRLRTGELETRIAKNDPAPIAAVLQEREVPLRYGRSDRRPGPFRKTSRSVRHGRSWRAIRHLALRRPPRMSSTSAAILRRPARTVPLCGSTSAAPSVGPILGPGVRAAWCRERAR